MGKKMTKESSDSIKQPKENLWDVIREQGTEVYLFLMLVIYPLLLVNGYSDLVYKKWQLFLYASAAFVSMSILCAAKDLITVRKKRKSGKELKGRCALTVTDGFVLVYLICAVISYMGAVDRQTGMWGVDTWYMGLVSQLLFVGIYFGVSRGYKESRYLKPAAALTGVIMGGIVILQRFGINVLNLYDGYGEDVKLEFVTTLGQVTWSSTYISILLVAGMGIYYMSEGTRKKLFWGSCIGVGFVTELLLNCDSGIIALFAAWMIMLWMSFGSRKRVLALLETMWIALLAAAAAGIAECLLADRMIPIDAVYLKAAQSKWVYVLLAVVIMIYWLISRDFIKISTKRHTVLVFRGIYAVLTGLGIIGIIVLFILHDKNYFNGSPTENYFRFTIWWGNSRGFIWRTGAAVFADFNVWRKLFGCGPDCFTSYAYDLMGDAINEFWHNQIVPNVHNEWFNALINYGICGGLAYLGIFVSAAYGFMKNAAAGRKREVLFAAGLAAAGYIAHNVLCYQQIIGTPLIFVLMGIGAALRKSE